MEEESQKIRIEDVSEFQKDFRAIVAEHVTFAYQNGDIILDDVSLRVNKGDLIAIVGESGIGKSTMMKLMLHLMPCESGKLYFETVNGKIEIDAGTRNVFSYVPQGNMIMSGTIRENITFCNHDIGEEEIRKANGDFLAEVKYLKEKAPDIDLVLFPVDRRMGKDYMKGAKQFIEQIKTTIFVPMHFSEDYEGGNALRSFAENAGCRFISITHRGESFEITK